jgi:hypothetical protein
VEYIHVSFIRGIFFLIFFVVAIFWGGFVMKMETPSTETSNIGGWATTADLPRDLQTGIKTTLTEKRTVLDGVSAWG